MKPPDLVLYNAVVHTMDPQTPTAHALACAGNRIVALGDGDTLCSVLGPGGRAIDLRGHTVVPGLTDAHLHFVAYGLRLSHVNVHEAPTQQQALDCVAERIAVSEVGQWIRGGGWNCNLWGDGTFPHRRDLDRVAPHNPVALSSKDGHSLWANSLALQRAGITAQTPDPAGGQIRRDLDGQPTGILQENAMRLVYEVIPRPTLEEAIAACKQGIAHAHRLGLTGVHDCEGAQALTAFQQLRRRGELTMRVLMHVPEETLDAAIEVGVQDGLGDEWIRLVGVKAFADGALGSRSAWMLAPYEDDPANLGIPTASSASLYELVAKAGRAGLSVAIHAIGDAANRAALDAIQAAREDALPYLRHRIEHVQLLHADDIPRLAQLGVVASMQPIHATSDMHIADLHWGRRAAAGYAWRSLLDSGAILAFGSDAPVETLSPLLGIHAAVTRRRADGSPGPEGWYPEQRLTVAEALYAYTVGPAYAAGEEKDKGSLTPGKLADLTILDRDIYQIDPMDILHTQVVATMVNGNFTYTDEGLDIDA